QKWNTFADNSAISFKTKSQVIEFDDITRRSKIKVIYSTEPKDVFLLKDDIDPLAVDSKYYDLISCFDKNLIDKKKRKDEKFQISPVYLAILCPEAEIVFDKKNLVRSESDFDTSYLTSIDGDDILIDDIQEWLSLLKMTLTHH
ncbi:9545_t:CDS:2, partial [Gigaspora rosea]